VRAVIRFLCPRALRLKPDFADAHEVLGTAFLRKRLPDEAIKVRSRKEAADWLRVLLIGWLDEDLQEPARIRETLRRLEELPALTRSRDPDLLARLPASKQKTWRDLWALMEAVSEKVKEKASAR